MAGQGHTELAARYLAVLRSELSGRGVECELIGRHMGTTVMPAAASYSPIMTPGDGAGGPQPAARAGRMHLPPGGDPGSPAAGISALPTAVLHLGVSPMSAASTTDEITAVIGQLAAAGTAARDAALRASTTQPCMRLALAILRAAPDLADAVRAGQLDLADARRTLLAHQHPAGNPLGITYLTAAEVSVLLRVSRSAVYRLLAGERLLAIKAGPRSMRIPEPSVCGYLTGQAIAAIGELGKPGIRRAERERSRDTGAPLPQP